MIDPKLLRSAPEEVARLLARRGYRFDLIAWQGLEDKRRHWQIETDRLRAARNSHAKAVGQARGRGEDIAPLLLQGEELTQGLSGAEQELNAVQVALARWQLDLPNLLHESVPDGAEESANVEISRHGELQTSCPGGQCPPEQQHTLDSYRTFSTVSTIGFVVSGVGAIGGTMLLLTTPAPRDGRAQISPFIGPTIAGARVTF